MGKINEWKGGMRGGVRGSSWGVVGGCWIDGSGVVLTLLNT